MVTGIWQVKTLRYFSKNPKKIDDFIHTQKRNHKTNLKNRNMFWDFFSLNPESMHQVMILFSDRSNPYIYGNMNGYGSCNGCTKGLKFNFKPPGQLKSNCLIG